MHWWRKGGKEEKRRAHLLILVGIYLALSIFLRCLIACDHQVSFSSSFPLFQLSLRGSLREVVWSKILVSSAVSLTLESENSFCHPSYPLIEAWGWRAVPNNLPMGYVKHLKNTFSPAAMSYTLLARKTWSWVTNPILLCVQKWPKWGRTSLTAMRVCSRWNFPWQQAERAVISLVKYSQ